MARATRELERLRLDCPSNDDQQIFLNAFSSKLRDLKPYDRPTLMLLQGPGGSGKTTTIKKAFMETYSLNKLALGCASTGIAANVYGKPYSFTTAHYLFKLPVEETHDRDLEVDLPYKSKLDTPKYEERLQLVKAASVIFWDEVHSNEGKCFEAAYDVLDNFIGKIVVLVGDICQILAIADLPIKEVVIANLFVECRHFERFQKFIFTKNMRMIAGQEKYLNIIQAIGYGNYSDDVTEHYYLPTDLPEINNHKNNPDAKLFRVYSVNHIIDREDGNFDNALEFLYPRLEFKSTIASTSMIMTVTNDKVDKWNSVVQSLNPNIMQTYKSSDNFEDVEDKHGYLAKILRSEIIHKFNAANVPPYELNLKVGDVCFITDHLDRSDGLVNQQRVLILGLHKYRIVIETIEPYPTKYTIPRRRFVFTVHHGQSFKVMRTQFPLRLAYACTYNKSQAQTLNKVIIDITHELFAHGFLYVGMSRVRISEKISFFCSPDQVEYDDFRQENYVIVTNVVYKEVLDYFDFQNNTQQNEEFLLPNFQGLLETLKLQKITKMTAQRRWRRSIFLYNHNDAPSLPHQLLLAIRQLLLTTVTRLLLKKVLGEVMH